MNEPDAQTPRANTEAASRLGVAAVAQREMIVQKIAHEADHARAALGIVGRRHGAAPAITSVP